MEELSMPNLTEHTVVYTDGACSGNPGPGGWAWIVPDGPFGSGAADHTTNQRMELQAVLEALLELSGPVEVVSDSTYVVNCFRDGWWEGWLKRNWKNSQKKPVANRDLWEPLIELYRSREDELRFTWVKGHSENLWNDYADRLAVEARFTQQPRQGSATPTTIQAPDDKPRSGESVAKPVSLVVLGHQPPEIGGYDENPIASRIRSRLTEIIRAKAKLEPDLRVFTGLRLGAEQLGAEAALAAGVPLVVVLPYPNPDGRWPNSSRTRFRELFDRAEESVLLQQAEPESPAKAGMALRRRDDWLASNAAAALIVWDRRDKRVEKTVRLFEAQLDDDVWIVDPGEL